MSYQLRIARAGLDPRLQGTTGEIDVKHSDRCPVMSGKGNCRCVPDIFITVGDVTYEVNKDGYIIDPNAKSNVVELVKILRGEMDDE